MLGAKDNVAAWLELVGGLTRQLVFRRVVTLEFMELELIVRGWEDEKASSVLAWPTTTTGFEEGDDSRLFQKSQIMSELGMPAIINKLYLHLAHFRPNAYHRTAIPASTGPPSFYSPLSHASPSDTAPSALAHSTSVSRARKQAVQTREQRRHLARAE